MEDKMTHAHIKLDRKLFFFFYSIFERKTGKQQIREKTRAFVYCHGVSFKAV